MGSKTGSLPFQKKLVISKNACRFDVQEITLGTTINERGAAVRRNGLHVEQQQADALGARLPGISLNLVP